MGELDFSGIIRGHEVRIEAVRAAFNALPGARTKADIKQWLHEHYPGLFEGRRIGTYLRGCSVNNPVAIGYHPNFPRFLFKKARGEFEPYNLGLHGTFDSKGYAEGSAPNHDEEDAIEDIRSLVADEVSQQLEEKHEFAEESHLRDFLASNLAQIEDGLTLWSGIKQGSVEHFLGTRRVDILAKDRTGTPVIIELKVSKGHERTVGQALYYRAKLKQMLGIDRARIIIIASEITEELYLAATEAIDLQLFTYSLNINLRAI